MNRLYLARKCVVDLFRILDVVDREIVFVRQFRQPDLWPRRQKAGECRHAPPAQSRESAAPFPCAPALFGKHTSTSARRNSRTSNDAVERSWVGEIHLENLHGHCGQGHPWSDRFRTVHAGISAKTPALEILPLLRPGMSKVIFRNVKRRRSPPRIRLVGSAKFPRKATSSRK